MQHMDVPDDHPIKRGGVGSLHCSFGPLAGYVAGETFPERLGASPFPDGGSRDGRGLPRGGGHGRKRRKKKQGQGGRGFLEQRCMRRVFGKVNEIDCGCCRSPIRRHGSHVGRDGWMKKNCGSERRGGSVRRQRRQDQRHSRVRRRLDVRRESPWPLCYRWTRDAAYFFFLPHFYQSLLEVSAGTLNRKTFLSSMET